MNPRYLTEFDRELIRYCRYYLEISPARIAKDLGVHINTVRTHAPDMILVKPVLEAFELSGMTESQVARGLGWAGNRKGTPDSSRVKRHLQRKKIHYGLAVRMILAMGVDPVEVGL